MNGRELSYSDAFAPSMRIAKLESEDLDRNDAGEKQEKQ